MNAARDAGDRFGSPHLGSGANTTQIASRTASPPVEDHANGSAVPNEATEKATTLNENLKNFGKFFRREGSGFGGFGR